MPPKSSKEESLADLLAQHEAINNEFAPTLQRYCDMARKALDLQVRIADIALSEAFPKARSVARSKIMTIPARMSPQKVNELINQVVNDKNVTVVDIVYDAVTFEYHLYGK